MMRRYICSFIIINSIYTMGALCAIFQTPGGHSVRCPTDLARWSGSGRARQVDSRRTFALYSNYCLHVDIYMRDDSKNVCLATRRGHISPHYTIIILLAFAPQNGVARDESIAAALVSSSVSFMNGIDEDGDTRGGRGE